jgi:hypothetical protein
MQQTDYIFCCPETILLRRGHYYKRSKSSVHARSLSNIFPRNLSWTVQQNPRVNQTHAVQLTCSVVDSIT